MKFRPKTWRGLKSPTPPNTDGLTSERSRKYQNYAENCNNEYFSLQIHCSLLHEIEIKVLVFSTNHNC